MYDMPSLLPSFYNMCISCENNSLLTDIYFILLFESKYTYTYYFVLILWISEQ